MAGIYIHIPFCRKACHYCNFHFSTTTSNKEPFLKALISEISLQKNYLSEPVSTIYFGGGTPSILPAEEIENIILTIRENFKVEERIELTLEANPDDISTEKLREWKAIGINRLSIGIQSFFEEDLKWMNRAHNATEAKNCIKLARLEGFDNLTIDLIYGTPTLTDDKWKANFDYAVSTGVNHLSCYALTVESTTALEKMISLGKLQDVDPEKQARHFEMLMQWTNKEGFEHYEISNFAKPGFRSRHNSSYWQGKPYLGLGPSAHSFNGKSRQWNVANNALYIQSISQGLIPFEVEQLTAEQKMNEYIMTGLRTIEGVSLAKIKDEFGQEKLKYVLENAGQHIHDNNLVISSDFLKTTQQGKLLADGIASDLFWMEEEVNS